MTVRVIYSDLDGTMVGPFGNFFRDDANTPTLEPARALVALHEADAALVLVSGRTRANLQSVGDVVGADGYIGEMGAVMAWDRGRQHELRRGAMPTSYAGTPWEVMHEGGLPSAIFARYAGRLEWHAPWHVGHEADVMVRGNVDLDEFHGWLADNGWDWLAMHDNGVLRAHQMPDGSGDRVHVYHLLPAGVDKGSAVAADLARRGLSPAEAVAVGDSLSDLTMAPYVGRFFLTANGTSGPSTVATLASHPNVTVTSGSVGIGWAEAVHAALAGS